MLAKALCPPTRQPRLGGILTAELLLVLPILLALILGTLEFSMMAVARQQVLVASREGARVAALGGSEDDIATAVQLYLGTGSLSNVAITTVLTDELGEPRAAGEPVQVIVSLRTAQAVPDLLAFIGFSIRNDTIVACTTMRKE